MEEKSRGRSKVEKCIMLSDIYETAKLSAELPVAPDTYAIRMFRMMLADGRSLNQYEPAYPET